jgi:RNA polymerase sigma-70 factor, ECF subfamily
MIEVPRIDRVASQAPADQAMDRYADGDATAFAVVYDELAPRLYRYALRQTRSRPAAEDVVQQTFLQIHLARDRFVRGASALTWTYAIARRLLIDATRRGRREELRGDGALGSETLSEALAADEAMDLKEQELLARRDLERLPAALREAFTLVKLEGLSVAQAAEVLGITPGMVKIRTHRAKVALASALVRGPRSAGDGPVADSPRARVPLPAKGDATP